MNNINNEEEITMMNQPSPQLPEREQDQGSLEIHPTLGQRILALLGVCALIGLFLALLYLIRTMV